MRNDIPFFPTKLTVLALLAVLAGCGGGEGGGSDQNQSSTQKPDNSDGGQAAKGPESPKTAEKPAEKFTPEMVKDAYKALINQNPNFFTEEEKARALAQMQEPEAVKGMTDKLNQAISEGKIDDKGLKVDEITVEALTKGLAAIMPQARKEGNQWKSYMKISDIESALSDYILDQEFKNNELDGSDAVVKYPAADQWCDALLKADKERFQKAIKELLACDKNGDKKINQEELRGINTDLVFLGYDFLDLDANENGSIDFPDEAPTPKLSLESFYSPQIPETAKLLAVKPADLKRTSHYAFNAAVAGKPKYIPHKWVEKDGAVYLVGRRKNFPDDQVLLFECDLGWNGSGGLEDALKYMDKHKLEKIAVATSDDRRVVTKEELKKLKWAPKE